jgi:hypothetical protein
MMIWLSNWLDTCCRCFGVRQESCSVMVCLVPAAARLLVRGHVTDLWSLLGRIKLQAAAVLWPARRNIRLSTALTRDYGSALAAGPIAPSYIYHAYAPAHAALTECRPSVPLTRGLSLPGSSVSPTCTPAAKRQRRPRSSRTTPTRSLAVSSSAATNPSPPTRLRTTPV